MRVCDICKTKAIGQYLPYKIDAIIDANWKCQSLEVCEGCRAEFRKRERQHRHLAYTETVQAITGEIPRQSHWWDVFKESALG